MPTATTTPRKTKARKTTKPARAKASRSKATQAKASRTRATNHAGAAARHSQAAGREGAEAFGDYAERAVLIPVGAALIARDRVVSTVSDTLTTYSSPTKTQAQLRRFERRGATARNRLEREVRKARARAGAFGQRPGSASRVGRQERQRARQPRPGARAEPRLRANFPRPARRGRRRESLPASYPAGSSSTLSSPRPAGGPHRPRVVFNGNRPALWPGGWLR
jgi:hypothetical protein